MRIAIKQKRKPIAPAHLKVFLENTFDQYHQPQYLPTDPLELPHRFPHPQDQEVVALLSALLAYGNAKLIRRAVEGILEKITSLQITPSAMVQRFASSKPFTRQVRAKFQDFYYRWTTAEDLLEIFRLIGLAQTREGSLGACFVKFLTPQDPTIASALEKFLASWKAQSPLAQKRSFQFLLSSPTGKSPCKRWCLFLRWMGRKDQLDLGLWHRNGPWANSLESFLDPAQLILPLDTHTRRICGYLGLIKKKTTLTWNTAVSVTQNLKTYDPLDPTRYDFALCRLGILNICQKRFERSICGSCPLLGACCYTSSHFHPKTQTHQPLAQKAQL